MTFKVKCLDDIVKLGWVGSFGADRERFNAVNEFIAAEPDLRVRQEANWLATFYGMDIITPRDEAFKKYDPAEGLPKPRLRRKLTNAQKAALKALWMRAKHRYPSYLKFRRTALWEACGDALIVPWCGMTVGIEPDGYTHS